MSETRRKLDKQAMGLEPGLPLEASAGGIEELRQDIQRLFDIEAIKQLKVFNTIYSYINYYDYRFFALL